MKVEYVLNASPHFLYTENQIIGLKLEEFSELSSDLEKLAALPPISYQDSERQKMNGDWLPKHPVLKTLDGKLVPLTGRQIEVICGDGFEHRSYIIIDTYKSDKPTNYHRNWVQRRKTYDPDQIKELK